MRVNETGEHGIAGKINDPRLRGDLHIASHRLDDPILDEQHRVAHRRRPATMASSMYRSACPRRCSFTVTPFTMNKFSYDIEPAVE